MLTHIKEDALRRLQAIDSEQQGTAVAFLELCSVCSLLAQELRPGLPTGNATLMDEDIIDGVFKLAKAAKEIAETLHAAASIGKAVMDEGNYDWEGFIRESKQFRLEANAMGEQIEKMFLGGAPVPDRMRIDYERQAMIRQREACSALRQTISPVEVIRHADSGNSVLPADRGLQGLVEWRKEVLETLTQWEDVLNGQEKVLTELDKWRSIVDTVRKHLDEQTADEEMNSSDDGVYAEGSADSSFNQAIGGQTVEIDDRSGPNKMKLQMLEQLFGEIKAEWHESNWVKVLWTYDEILRTGEDNTRARRERPLALCCFIETLVLKYQSDMKPFQPHPKTRLFGQNFGTRETRIPNTSQLSEYFTSEFSEYIPDREAGIKLDFTSLVKMPTPPWNDERLKDAVWEPFFKHSFLKDEQQYVDEFKMELRKLFPSS